MMFFKFIKDFTSQDGKVTVNAGTRTNLKSVLTPNADTVVSYYIEDETTNIMYRVNVNEYCEQGECHEQEKEEA